MIDQLYGFENIREIGRDGGIVIYEARRQGLDIEVILYQWPVPSEQMVATKARFQQTLASRPDLDTFSTDTSLWVEVDKEQAQGTLSQLRSMGLFHLDAPSAKLPEPVIFRNEIGSATSHPKRPGSGGWVVTLAALAGGFALLVWIVSMVLHPRREPPSPPIPAPSTQYSPPPEEARPEPPKATHKAPQLRSEAIEPRSEAIEPIIDLQPANARVSCGETVTLTWSVRNAESVLLDDKEPVPEAGHRDFKITVPRRVYITAKGKPVNGNQITRTKQSEINYQIEREKEWEEWRRNLMDDLHIPSDRVNSRMKECQELCVAPSRCKL